MNRSTRRVLVHLFGALLVFLPGFMVAGCKDHDSDPPPPSSATASAVVGPGGGTVSVTDAASPIFGTAVVIPAGALSSPTTITISQVTGATDLPSDVLVVDLGPTGTVFSAPVSVTIKYGSQYLATNGISDPATLKVVSMDSGAARETLKTTSQDTGGRTVTAETTHFSSFAVVGFTNATLSGPYAVTFYYVDVGAGPPKTIALDVPSVPHNSVVNVPVQENAFNTELGTLTFDGAGGYTYSATRNRGGASSAVSASGTYSVAADGTLTLNVGGTALSGNALAGGSSFILTATSGETVQMGVGVKKGGAFSNASLSGAYTVAFYDTDVGGGPPKTISIIVPSVPHNSVANVPIPGNSFNIELGTLTFDAAGGYTHTATRNKGGVVSPVSTSGTYSVDVAGALTLSGTGLTGNVLAGGSTFILAATSGQGLEIGVGLKEGGTFSNASLSGSYAVAFHYTDVGAGPPKTIPIIVPSVPHNSVVNVPFPSQAINAERGTLTFDGVGGFSYSATRNKGGVTSAVSASGTYSVAANGALTLSGPAVSGSVLAGGSTFILASTSGEGIQIGVGILR
jgi:hypothetical protein